MPSAANAVLQILWLGGLFAFRATFGDSALICMSNFSHWEGLSPARIEYAATATSGIGRSPHEPAGRVWYPAFRAFLACGPPPIARLVFPD
jgi:hypothetical protein